MPDNKTKPNVTLDPTCRIFQVGTPELTNSLMDSIAKQANLEEAIKELPLITVESVLMWSQQRAKPVSESTINLFLNKREDAGDLISKTDEHNRKYWVRSPAWNKSHPISKAKLELKASIENYRKLGYTD